MLALPTPESASASPPSSPRTSFGSTILVDSEGVAYTPMDRVRIAYARATGSAVAVSAGQIAVADRDCVASSSRIASSTATRSTSAEASLTRSRAAHEASHQRADREEKRANEAIQQLQQARQQTTALRSEISSLRNELRDVTRQRDTARTSLDEAAAETGSLRVRLEEAQKAVAEAGAYLFDLDRSLRGLDLRTAARTDSLEIPADAQRPQQTPCSGNVTRWLMRWMLTRRSSPDSSPSVTRSPSRAIASKPSATPHFKGVIKPSRHSNKLSAIVIGLELISRLLSRKWPRSPQISKPIGRQSRIVSAPRCVNCKPRCHRRLRPYQIQRRRR